MRIINKFGFIPSILMIFILPLVGYIAMHGGAYVITYLNEFYYYLYTAFLLILLLFIPYGMLKFLFHAMHIKNHSEKELNLKDLPKQARKINKTK